ncbi:hypothetical protein HMPREF0972_00180 [Actinomyces sp. oral taxon 848 str. F0332]|nr:hypothetical protein HMPREF0972_00180 [Actinomyces sp. oral taxon 848 str. F0332]
MDDDVETESLLDDEILSLLGGCRSWAGVSPGRMSLSAGRRGRRRRRAANMRRDGLTRASVARNQALAP